MNFLSKKIYSFNPDVFGLDVSDNTLKFVQLKKDNDDYDLVAFGSYSYESGLIAQGQIINKDKFKDVLKNSIYFSDNVPQTKYVAVSLPDEHSFLRVLRLPKLDDENEIYEAVKWEMEKNIPLSINEVYFDFEVIKQDDLSLDHQDVLVCASPRKIVFDYYNILDSVGLIPASFEPKSISIARSVIKNGKTDYPVMIVDIGTSTTNFIIFSDKTVKFSSIHPFGGQKMILLIQRGLGVSKIEAKKLFYEVGFDKELDKDGKVTNVLDPIFFNIISRMKNYITFYNDHSKHDHFLKENVIKKILISGGVANLYGITSYISSRLKIETEIANPWINVLKPPLKETPQISFKKSLGYAAAIGLALKHFYYDKF